MPQYAILTYSPAPADPMALTPEYAELLERYPAQVEELGGQIVTGFALQPSTTATSVRGDVVTDGPFVEAKEVVAGFFVLEAPDLDVALRIARLNPVTRDGGVEVRPLFVPPAEWATAGRSRSNAPWRRRTAASGPSCSPRRCASPATSTWPRSASRRPTRRR